MMLPDIPLVDVGPNWPVEALALELDRAHALLTETSRGIPASALRVADGVSRRWLRKWHEPYLAEIDLISEMLARPGAHYLNVSYEWGCTTNAGPSPDGASARLLRVLDWPNRGLGRYIMAARVAAAAGPFVTLTWPGYTGVLQGVAHGRFAACLNQAPMDRPTRFLPTDWFTNRVRVWRSGHITPAHLLRRVFEEAATYDEAKQRLIETPIVLPTIYTLAGVAPHEACVIERRQTEAFVIEGPACAANDWTAPGWSGRARGDENEGRRCAMGASPRPLDEEFPWLKPPVFNDRTRLAMAADASSGALVACGYEKDGPATNVLNITAAATR